MMPRVSVVIPAHNRAGVIGAAVDSVLRQSLQATEILVVDDGSSDGTADAASASGDPRVRVLRLEHNRGAAAARNAGVAAASADLVAFQDSDDEWLPLKLTKQVTRLAESPGAVAVYCGLLIVTPLEATPQRRPPAYMPAAHLGGVDGDVLPALLRSSFVSTQTLLAPRQTLLATPFDETLHALEDWDCAIRLAQRGPLALVDEPLVLQRFSPNSITRGARRLVEARASIVAKHSAAMAHVPGCLADHYLAIAGGWRRQGERAAARTAALEALRHDPMRVRSWLSLALAALSGGARPAGVPA